MFDMMKLLLIIFSLEINCLEIYRTYKDSSHRVFRFENIAIDKYTGDVYVGAQNRLLRFSSDLNLQQSVITGPVKDNPRCPPPIVPCGQSKSYMNTYSKALAIDYNRNILIFCTSLFHGFCEHRSLKNISQSSRAIYKTMVSNDQSSPSLMFLAPGPTSNENSLYIASSFTSYGNIEYRKLVPAISSRNPQTFKFTHRSELGATFKKFLPKYRGSLLVKYTYGFSHAGFIYFITQQAKSLLDSRMVSKMIRICEKDIYFNSYIETAIECTRNDDIYDFAQDSNYMENDGGHLYIIFKKNLQPSRESMQSILCDFKMQDVAQHFNEAVADCYQGIGYLGPAHIFTTKHCPELNLKPDYCGKSSEYPAIVSSLPLETKSLLHMPDVDISACTATYINNFPIVFMGTHKGSIIKAIMKADGNFTVASEVVVQNNVPIKRGMHLAPDKQTLYVMTTSKLASLTVSSCAIHSDCETCLAVPDPYCGWCTMKNSCTRKSECGVSDITPSWLPASAKKCATIKNLQPNSISVEKISHGNYIKIFKFKLENIELSPGVRGQVRCHYRGYNINTLENAKVGDGEIISCPFPTNSKFTRLEVGQGQKDFDLSVIVSDQFIAKRVVSIYDCRVHNKCRSCTETPFSCEWCPATHLCETSLKTCMSPDKRPAQIVNTSHLCPVIGHPHKDLVVHSGEQKEISFPLKNLDRYMLPQLKCHFYLPSGLKVVRASYTGGQLYCDLIKFSYLDDNKPFLMTEFKVTWGMKKFVIDNPHNVQVKVYKCPLMVKNCGECLTIREVFNCGWCGQQCTLKKYCNKTWLDRSLNCPSPKIISFFPKSGPIDGKTNISISGINLGKKIRDIQGGVTVAGSPCTVKDIDYIASARFVCEIRGADKLRNGAVVVKVSSLYIAHSKDSFSFVKPELTTIIPSRSAVSGGVNVTLKGKFLDTGSSVNVKMGNNSCQVIRRNFSSLTFLSVRQQSHGKVSVKVDFGGAEFESPVPFIYVPDPTILSVEPRVAFFSGGTRISLIGTNLDVVSVMRLYIYLDHSHTVSECTRHSSSVFHCVTPNLSIYFKTATDPKLVHYGVSIDNVPGLLHLSEKPNFGPLHYYPDPVIQSISGKNPLLIKGNFENMQYVKDEVLVSVGSTSCSNVTIYNNFITCLPPHHPRVIRSDKAAVEIRIGNYYGVLGSLVYYTGSGLSLRDKPVALGVVLGVVLPILIIITLIIFCIVRRHMKHLNNPLACDEDTQKAQDILLNNVHFDYNHKDTSDYVEVLISGLKDTPLERDAREIMINRSHLDIGSVIGQGFFCTVFRAELTDDQNRVSTVAVKSLNNHINGNNNLRTFIKEATLLKDLSHPNVVTLRGISLAPFQNPVIVLPYFPEGDLRTHVSNSEKSFTVYELLELCVQVVEGMIYLSEHNVIHRNLAARNCMISSDNRVKVSDYGLTQDLSQTHYNGSNLSVSPLRWRAPETFNNSEFSLQSDVWSYGVLMWEVLTRGLVPYSSIQNEALHSHLTSGHRLSQPQCSDNMYLLMASCWQEATPERPEFKTLRDELVTLMSSPTDQQLQTLVTHTASQDISSVIS